MPDVLGGLLRAKTRPQTYRGLPVEEGFRGPSSAQLESLRQALLAPARLMTHGADRPRSDPRYGPGLLGDFNYATDPSRVFGGTGNVLAMVLPPGAPKVLRPIPKPVLTDLRGLPVEEAIGIASSEPHLIPKKGGGFVGGPPGVKTRADLLVWRRRFDKRVQQGKDAADWYERYGAGTTAMTGGDPRDAAFASGHQALHSAGRAPQHELQGSLLENQTALVTGRPERANYGTQQARVKTAIKENDPGALTRGTRKIDPYASKVNPQVTFDDAVGTNDFRQANNWGFKVGSGTSKTSLTPAQHRFVDYENALAVKRAREAEVGGRADWTGKQVQAAPWVVDKAEAIVQRRGLLKKYMKEGHGVRAATKKAYDEAFAEANKVPADFFPEHSVFMTHEAQPGQTGHLPGSLLAPQPERTAFGRDPRSQWGYAPGGRDAIYAGLRLGETGVAGRVLPSQPAAGWWGGKSNPVEVSPVLVPFPKGRSGTIHPRSRQMLEAGETLRAAVDVQEAGAGHMVGTVGPRRSVHVPMNRPLKPKEMFKLNEAGKKHGLLDLSDTGQGVTITSFGSELPRPGKGLLDDIAKAAPKDAVEAPFKAKIDSIWTDLSKRWTKGEGSGAVTRLVLQKLNVTKQMRAAFDNNPHLAEGALNRIARDREWASKWGVQRKDVERFRKIVASGKGWIGRLEKQLRDRPGTLPVLATGVLVGLNESGETPQD